MKLISLEINEQFRSLHSGFKINFRKITDTNIDTMNRFQPFCFAGLNGSGKSNVLEALSSIFYHLEFCVAKFKPNSFELYYKRNLSSPDAYTLQYLICDDNNDKLSHLVTVTKEKLKEPRMTVQKIPVDEEGVESEISLLPTKASNESAAGKYFLPDLVVGYSSGENEILSLPFIKTRLVHFDEYKESSIKGLEFKESETSLLYIDEEMSQALLLACMLFEDEETLKPLKYELGIIEVQSFRMHLKNNVFSLSEKTNYILDNISKTISRLKKCTPFSYLEHGLDSHGNKFEILTLDFLINDHSKRAFKEHFESSFELFQFFKLLYELNNYSISEETKEEVYKSRGIYTDGKVPIPSIDDKVFHFLDYMILKKVSGDNKLKELRLREFSDGEHQFLHTMGICLMIKDRRTLLLLDEPETHFNPGWRAKFIKVLNDSVKAGGGNCLLKDIIITSHSPYIISDCSPNSVIYFNKDKNTKKVQAISAKDMGVNTYGTSVEIISDELFDYNQSIGDLANEELNTVDLSSVSTFEDIESIKKRLSYLGESIEKDLILAKINRIKI